jgi:hypothetical protein
MRPYTTLFAASVLMVGSALAMPDGTGGHHHHTDHGAVSAPSAAAAPSGYGAAQSGYGAPDAGYASLDYSAPSEGYADYSAGYVEPQDSYDAADRQDSGLGAILIPLLIAAALFLLIPGTRVVPVEKRKRSADDAPSSNMIERVQDIYMSVLESEECIERIVCEIGGLAEDAGFSKKMTKSLELFAPKKYQKMMKTFNHGKDCKKNNKCGYF